MRLHPLATFDCLYLGEHLQRQIGGFTSSELQLFSYLACLLWLYRRKPQTDWGYVFVGTELGAPYSAEIDLAAQTLERQAYFTRSVDRLQVAKAGSEWVSSFREQGLYHDRIESLRASSASAVAFSVGTIREALSQEPELNRAKALPMSRVLLQDTAIRILYEQFGALTEALGGEAADLRLPAVAWLTALFHSSGV